MPNIAVEQEIIAATITIALVILYLHAADEHQHTTFQPKPSSEFAVRH